MNDGTTSKTYSVGELAEAVGITRRAIRYYVQQGVLPPPIGLGRGAHYTEEHVEALRRVLALQETGVQLAEMRAEVADRGALPDPLHPSARFRAHDVASTLEPTQWVHAPVDDGVELLIRFDRIHDVSPELLASIGELLRAGMRAAVLERMSRRE